MNSIRYFPHLQRPFIQEMKLTITVLSKHGTVADYEYFVAKLRENHSIKPEQQQNTGTSCLHCPLASIHSRMGVWSWLQKKFSKRKAEKEPEEFEFRLEDLGRN